ncbi:IclR family transcriptional regulator [Marinimicrobium alkaliphilum]|uniref:IclR family transcriptional regulator n=1 Tax=Marinimicrobium alkaliphilum TaxID=2202654 RepID=UPI000DBA9B1E|nr:IclR family transcriptional regulator [Marinimicrobium alkaliphilum]
MNETVKKAEGEEDTRKYKAPALEKGLDILELLAEAREPLTTSQIASRLGRSVSELFRMVLALEYRGYIEPVEDERDGYTLSNKLFTLGMSRGPTKTMLEIALPVMSALTQRIGQSCHLVVASGDQIVVIARMESPGDVGFSVRIGHRKPIIASASGLNLFAHRDAGQRQLMLDKLRASGVSEADIEDFVARAEEVEHRGYVQKPSDFTQGVTDLSVPIIGANGALATLTVPFVSHHLHGCSMEEALEHLLAATRKISAELSVQSTH